MINNLYFRPHLSLLMNLIRLHIALILAAFIVISCKEDRSPKNVFKPALVTNDATVAINTPLESSELIIIPQFKSNHVDSRQVEIYVPKGYPEKGVSYQVLYMHDGQNVFNKQTSNYNKAWEIDEKMDSLLAIDAVKPTIVVASWCHLKKRFNEYMPQQPGDLLNSAFAKAELKKQTGYDQLYSNNYLKFITQELKPYIDKNFQTDPKENVIMGSSMGGLISLYAFMEYPDIFKKAGCLSTHWPVPILGEEFMNSLPETIPDPSSRSIYFDYGTKTLDQDYEPHQLKVDAMFTEKGYGDMNYKSLKFEGHEHDEDYWRQRVATPLVFLLK